MNPYGMREIGAPQILGSTLQVARTDSLDPFEALQFKLEQRISKISKIKTTSQVDSALLLEERQPELEKETTTISVPANPSSMLTAEGGKFDMAINGVVLVGIAIAAVGAFILKNKQDEEQRLEEERLRIRALEEAAKIAAERAEARRKQEELVRTRALEEAALKLRREKEAEEKAEADRRAEVEVRRLKKAQEDEFRRVAQLKAEEAERKRLAQEAAAKQRAEEEAAAKLAAQREEAQRERERIEKSERAAAEAKAKAAAKAAEEIRLAKAKQAAEEATRLAAAEAARREKAQAEEKERAAKLLQQARAEQFDKEGQQDHARVQLVRDQAMRLTAHILALESQHAVAEEARGQERVAAVKKQVQGLDAMILAAQRDNDAVLAAQQEVVVAATKRQAAAIANAVELGEQDARVSAVKRQAAILARTHASASAPVSSSSSGSSSGSVSVPMSGSKPASASASASANVKAQAQPAAAAAAVPADPVLDEMQLSAERAFPGESPDKLMKRLDEIITLIAKAPVSKLRSIVSTRRAELLPPAGTGLEATVKTTLESYWLSTGCDWSSMTTAIKTEMEPIAAEASAWMRLSVTTANELSEARIKDLIKTRGGGRVQISRPKVSRAGKVDSDENIKGKSSFTKADYITVLVDLLRSQEENDYGRVAKLLQAETTTAGKKKGFSNK